MAFFYVIGCIIILGINFDFIIPAVKTICKLAFTPGAAAGGLVGRGIMMAMQYGIARGLFSNESGMGSAPIAAAAAQTRNPVRQALGFQHRNLLGYRCSLSDDRSCSRYQHYEKPVH